MGGLHGWIGRGSRKGTGGLELSSLTELEGTSVLPSGSTSRIGFQLAYWYGFSAMEFREISPGSGDNQLANLLP